MKRKRIIFVDRDGTLIYEPEDQQVDSLEKLQLIEHVIPCLLELQKAGYHLVMISNQDGLGTSSFPQRQFYSSHHKLLQILHSQGIIFDAVLICPHHPQDGCDCRKPHAGLLINYLQDSSIDWKHTHIIGDRLSDMQLAKRVHAQGWCVGDVPSYTKHTWPEITRAILIQPRTANIQRKTKETSIDVYVNLDHKEESSIDTQIPFLDHMLDQIAHHGRMTCHIHARGDLKVDDHHTIEDIAITLGEALSSALSDRKGIERFGFALPMDDASCEVLLDLVARPYFKMEGKFPAYPLISGISGLMFEHFFRSLCYALQCNLHLKVQGENPHHMVESAFKCFAKALRCAVNPQGATSPFLFEHTSSMAIASSKGVL